MSVHRTAQRVPVIERRPAVAAVVHRSAAASTGHGLQARLGNQATQALIARTVSPSIQTAAAWGDVETNHKGTKAQNRRACNRQ